MQSTGGSGICPPISPLGCPCILGVLVLVLIIISPLSSFLINASFYRPFLRGLNASVAASYYKRRDTPWGKPQGFKRSLI
jgi:hypothetical protein